MMKAGGSEKRVWGILGGGQEKDGHDGLITLTIGSLCPDHAVGEFHATFRASSKELGWADLHDTSSCLAHTKSDP